MNEKRLIDTVQPRDLKSQTGLKYNAKDNLESHTYTHT